MNATNTRSRISEIVTEIGEIDAAPLTESADLRTEYGLDSISLLEIKAAVECEFGVVFDDKDTEQMSTLAGICDALDRALSAMSPSPS